MLPGAEAARDPIVSVRANALLPGLYAWVSTVALPASSGRASLAAQIAALLALGALVVGSWLAPGRTSLARLVGVVAFVTLSTITWLLLGDLVAMSRLEPSRAALGGVAWALFAFGWGAVRRPDAVPEEDPRVIPGDVLEPRRPLPRGASVIVAIALLLGLAPIFLAWRIPREEHALFGHAAALAAAIAVISVGATVAVQRGNWRPALVGRRRIARASGPLAALLVLFVIGIFVRVLG